MSRFGVFALFAALALPAFAADKKQPAEPSAFGIISGNTSCVIFAEAKKNVSTFHGTDINTTTVLKLTLLESMNYKFDRKVIEETQDSMDALMQQAQKDKIKFVKIPEKSGSDVLEKARAMCKQDMQ